MKARILLLAMIVIVSLSFVNATPNITVEKIVKDDIIISELDKPAVFDLVINNTGEPDKFKVYTLVGVRIEPSEEFELQTGEETTVEIKAFLNEQLRKERTGLLSFEYQIKGRNSGIFKDKLLVKIVKLQDLFELRVEPLHPDDKAAKIVIKNRENTRLENVSVFLDSPFFQGSEVVSLEPYSEKEISVALNKEGREKLLAGPYILFAKIKMGNAEAELEGIVEFLEKEGILPEQNTEGFVIKKTVVKRTNRGNVPANTTIEIKKDIISRFFTTSTPEPDEIRREGFYVSYFWRKTLLPDETFVVEAETNYTFPFILIVLIVLAGVLAKIYFSQAVLLRKTVSFVRTKGGEFALKVKVQVKARKSVENVQLIDTLPRMTKLFEKFGKKPDKIDSAARKMFWNLGSLRKGEERIYSYIIYSKLNVVGRFELPQARVVFERNGKVEESKSNRAFFAAEKD